MRIGEIAERVGTTPRTIRYYEEIGLLWSDAGRAAGAHRSYDESDVERLELILRIRDLLGVPLEEIKPLLQAEDTLELIRRRRDELDRLEAEVIARRARKAVPVG
jgi:MerR family transcriptional regulator, repressor of the yfmOP operon